MSSTSATHQGWGGVIIMTLVIAAAAGTSALLFNHLGYPDGAILSAVAAALALIVVLIASGAGR